MNTKSSKYWIFLFGCALCGSALLSLAGAARGVALEPVWENLPQITSGHYLPHAPQQLLVTQKTGEVRWLHEGSGRSEVVHRFRVATHGELGLLALVLHPDFPADPRVFVHINPDSATPRSQILQLRWSQTPGRTPVLQQAEVLLDVVQPYSNHNGGGLAFGPDGQLYVGFGDGGSNNDTARRAQNPASLLGKILRLNVDERRPGVPYAIPPDNPFVAQPEVRPELWASGVRNPIDLTFDTRGQLWVADAGLADEQEINRVVRGDNLGWRCYLGQRAFERDVECAGIVHQPPVLTYELRGEQRVTGGLWYRGDTQPWLRDHYLFADFMQGYVWAMDDAHRRHELGRWDIHPSSFIERPNGDVLIADFVGGTLYRLIDAASAQ
ncbi:PQQ-dependent sugar dehydrogenase [Salinispirillum sp. LH 10-3-1]|uniref:PQQ-dependent sugar dehydrogenase n=1 Tax=Salinispirillum sp. LH 10-3-1 TaxID=2952525 RepID=A0AB38YGH1_9GAMM